MSNKRSHSRKESWTLSPVANPNAMNVIVVAAECAPWSKTGTHIHRLLVAPMNGNYPEPKGVGVLKKVQGLGGYILSLVDIDCVDFDFTDSQTFTKMHRFYYHQLSKDEL
ncbi:unnamed protein product [Musa hybrid cultivar]